MHKNFSIYKRHIFLQMLILVLIILLPLYFYIKSEKENIDIKERQNLQHYAQKVANAIYTFSNSNDKEFFFPRSNIYKSAIFTKDKRVIFSLFENNIDIDSIKNSKHLRAYILKLKPNIFNAYYLLVAKQKSYSKLIANIVVILIVSVSLIFLAIFSIIKQSSKPYEELNRYLENFIKDAMHELKTPMGIMLLNLDGLRTKYKNDKMLTRARSALKNMIVIYEDLEYFVLNRSHKSKAKEINLSTFTAERVEFFDDLLKAKDINITLNIQESIHITISPLELSRIIDNTLSNAIKYSLNNTSIHITLKRENSFAKLCIEDNGKGIEDISKIFDRYYRADKISGGFGIGLNIVKKICDKYNIKISVASTPKKGSTFCYGFSL